MEPDSVDRIVKQYKANASNKPARDADDDTASEISSDSNQPCCYRYLWSQTTLPSLILYSYFYWYFLAMFAFGFQSMSLKAWTTGSLACHILFTHSIQLELNQKSHLYKPNLFPAVVLASLVCIALNANAYHSPPCGQGGYFRHYFKIIKFWLIPFCVSSISVACNTSPTECSLLFPTNTRILMIHLLGIAAILGIGLLVHYLILPRCKTDDRPQEEGARESQMPLRRYVPQQNEESLGTNIEEEELSYDAIPLREEEEEQGDEEEN